MPHCGVGVETSFGLGFVIYSDYRLAALSYCHSTIEYDIMFVEYHLYNPNSLANDVVVPSRVGSSLINVDRRMSESGSSQVRYTQLLNFTEIYYSHDES